jgi:hypothetical protein
LGWKTVKISVAKNSPNSIPTKTRRKKNHVSFEFSEFFNSIEKRKKKKSRERAKEQAKECLHPSLQESNDN